MKEAMYPHLVSGLAVAATLLLLRMGLSAGGIDDAEGWDLLLFLAMLIAIGWAMSS
ncbi:MAG: hypothetical protein ACYDDA_09110 [Acidiferrobacteraceae bacterium]